MSIMEQHLAAVESVMPFRVVGRVTAISGLTIEASDLPLPLGSVCRIQTMAGGSCMTEIVGFESETTLLMPLSSTAGVARGDAIENVTGSPRIGVSDDLLGRVIDGYGNPIDGKGPLPQATTRRIDGRG